MLGALGKREGDDGKTISPLDGAACTIIRRRSLSIVLRSAMIALVATLICWLV